MGFKNPRGVSIDEETWQKLEQLQEITGLSKAQIIRNLLKKELRLRGQKDEQNP